jgi:hypothetical protein
MQTRQNPIKQGLLKIENLLQRMIEGPFDRSSKVEPAALARKLETAMEEGQRTLDGGRHLVPNVYDIYVSMKDHRELMQVQKTLIEEWKRSLIEFARQQRYNLLTDPVLRLHGDSQLRPGKVRIEAHIEDPKQAPPGGGGGLPGDMMGTAQLSPEQLAQLRANLAASQPAAAAPPAFAPPVYPYTAPGGSAAGAYPASPQSAPFVALPEAWLSIRLPQGGREKYPIKKEVISIGRQRYNDIVVEDKKVSRDHAKIMYQNGAFVIYDLGSTNGITINGRPHMRQHTLNNGDRFTIGSYDFYFQRL